MSGNVLTVRILVDELFCLEDTLKESQWTLRGRIKDGAFNTPLMDFPQNIVQAARGTNSSIISQGFCFLGLGGKRLDIAFLCDQVFDHRRIRANPNSNLFMRTREHTVKGTGTL